MKDTVVLESIADMQEVFDVGGYALEQQGYSVFREGDKLTATAGNIFLKKVISLSWTQENITVTSKGSQFVIGSDVKLLTDTLGSLREALYSGNFTEENRIFNFSGKHF